MSESPVVDLIRAFWQEGIDAVVYDPNIHLAKMLGSNREYLQGQLPQIKDILCATIADILRESEAVVVNQNWPEFIRALEDLNGRIDVLDLVRLGEDRSPPRMPVYRGISW